MSVRIAGTNGTTLAEVDATMKAQRVSIRPAEVLGWYSVGSFSGAATVVAANGNIFAFRNLSANPIQIRRVGVGHVVTTGFTAGQMLQLRLHVARNWTVSSSGGTAITFTGNNGAHRQSHATPTAVDCRIATTAALTPGTFTADANSISCVAYYAATTTVGNILPFDNNNLLSQAAGDFPIIVGTNEGIVIQNGIVHGAGGVGTYTVGIEFAEMLTY